MAVGAGVEVGTKVGAGVAVGADVDVGFGVAVGDVQHEPSPWLMTSIYPNAMTGSLRAHTVTLLPYHPP